MTIEQARAQRPFKVYTLGREHAREGADWSSLIEDTALRELYERGQREYEQGMRE